MGNTMVVALDNLENAAVQKNDTVERLVISNLSLSASLAARNTEIARLLTVITNISTRGGGNRGGEDRINKGKATGETWVRVGHSSDTCNKRKDRNDAHLTAKREDIQGGCEWNRTWKPRAN